MRAGLREWVHSVQSRQGIYSLNSLSLSVFGGHSYNCLGLGLPLFCLPLLPSSHLSRRDVSMRNKQPRLWPFDRETVGNKTREDRERKWIKKEASRALPHWELCRVEPNDNASERWRPEWSWADDGVTDKSEGSSVWHEKSNKRYGKEGIHVFWPSVSQTNHVKAARQCCLSLYCDRLETAGYSRAPPQVNMVLFTCVQWDSFIPSLNGIQLCHCFFLLIVSLQENHLKTHSVENSVFCVLTWSLGIFMVMEGKYKEN